MPHISKNLYKVNNKYFDYKEKSDIFFVSISKSENLDCDCAKRENLTLSGESTKYPNLYNSRSFVLIDDNK
jgi:hypothetical protein